MSTVADFNYIEDCDKVDSQCVDAFVDFHLDESNPTGVCLESSWGGDCLDLTGVVNAAETLTTLYLSPDENPNCLVYEPERGDNICIHGDDLSRIISMTKLKDVDQSNTPSNGDVYIYNNGVFTPYDLQTFVTNTNTSISNAQTRLTAVEGAISALQTRIANIEALLVKPENSPSDAKIVWGKINLYSDPNAAVDSSGNVTSLDKTHGLYSHNLNITAYGDEIMG